MIVRLNSPYKFSFIDLVINSLGTVKFQKLAPPNISPQNRNAEDPPLNRPSEYKPSEGGLYLEFALEYKVKQNKNGKFPSHYKPA